MKKLLIALLALCLLVCLVSCNDGNGAETEAPADNAPAETVAATDTETETKAAATEKVQEVTGDGWTKNY